MCWENFISNSINESVNLGVINKFNEYTTRKNR